MNVPFYSFRAFDDTLKQQYLNKVKELLNSHQYILGEEVTAFEKNFAAYCGTAWCKGVGNGLDALTIGLKALGIQAGDEVIVPAHTFIATWLGVSACGATPVAVDADAATCNINPALIEEKITAKTKAIIPVHLYGRLCPMEQVMSIAARHGLAVVEDFAQAQGASAGGKKAGSFGHISATSFYPAKNIGALGDAGAVVTGSASLAEKAALLRNYGSPVKYEHEEAGGNTRLDSMQAAALSIKLPLLDGWNLQRIAVAKRYTERLSEMEGIEVSSSAEGTGHVYHLYVIQAEARDTLQQFLSGKGIGTIIHYPKPPHLQKAYGFLGMQQGQFPVAEKLARTVLSLPMFPGITESEVDYVCDSIRSFYNK